MRIVDAHHHLWDPTSLKYALLDGKGRLAPLARPVLAAEFDRLADAYGIAEAIVVEAASAGADCALETPWLLAEAARSRVSRRVVAYAPVESEDIGGYLDRLMSAGAGRLVGVRRSFESVPDGFMLSDAVVSGIRAVAARGVPFDVVLFADRLGEAFALARRLPEAIFVLDHLGKPPIRTSVPQRWIDDIGALGQLDNVVAKVSGLATEATGEDRAPDILRPYVEHAVEAFGWSRLMFGSDWPMCELAGGYASWLGFAAALTKGLAEGDRTAFFSGTADRIYSSMATRT